MVKVKLELRVTGCRYNDLRSGDRQWTIILEGDAGGTVEVYSPLEVPVGAKAVVEIDTARMPV